MLKKVSLLLLVLGLFYVWNQYGYLIRSSKNFAKPATVSTEPLDLKTVSESDKSLSFLRLPSGYTISYFTQDVPGARSLAVGANDVVFVGTRGEGVVYAIDSDKRYVVASGLNNPNGVAYQDGTLYVAEIGRIIKFEGIDQTYRDKPAYKVVYDKLPTDPHHGWRYIAFGPDNLLYISIGFPCNVCDDEDMYGRIIRINPKEVNGGFEVYVLGVRNSVGFDWDPQDSTLWFTDNGRDLLGDDIPPDELNHASTKDLNFGFPFCHGGDILDPKFGQGKDCGSYSAPSLNLSPHAAALGMKFVNGQILIAEHGSWNRKTPIGYRVMSVDVENGVASNYQVFVDGWLRADGKALGRPVDLLELSDGSLLISDDFAGAIYRLTKEVK